MLGENDPSKCKTPGARLLRHNLFLQVDCSPAAIGADLARREFGKIPIVERHQKRDGIKKCTEELIGAIDAYVKAANEKPDESGRPHLVEQLREAYDRAAEDLVALMRHSFCCPSCTTINNPDSGRCVSCDTDLRSYLAEDERGFLTAFTNPYPFASHELFPMTAAVLQDVMGGAVRRAAEIACGSEPIGILDELYMAVASFVQKVEGKPNADALLLELTVTQLAYEGALRNLARHVSQISCRECGTSQPNLLDSCQLCGTDFDRHGRRPLRGADYVIIQGFRSARVCYQSTLVDAASLLPPESRDKLGSLCERNRQGMSALDILAELGKVETA